MTRSLLILAALVLAGSAAGAQEPPQETAPEPGSRLIGLLMVPELMPGDCQPFAPASLPLYAARGGAPIGEMRGAGRPPTTTVCEFPDVRAVFGRRSFEIATEEHGYEERSLIVTATVPGWYQVATGGRPALVWVRPTARSVYRPLADLFKESLTYLGEEWDRRLYTSPGGSFSLLARPVAANERFEPMVEVNEVARVKGVYWADVTFIENPCTPDEPSGRGRGWVRVHGPQPSDGPVLWFHSRGC